MEENKVKEKYQIKTIELIPLLDKDQKTEIYRAILEAWEARRATGRHDSKHKKTKELQVEFILGAVTALDLLTGFKETSIPPMIFFKITRGEYITKDDV